MSGFLQVFKNNFRRYRAMPSPVILVLGFLAASVALAAFFGANAGSKGNVALVGETDSLMANVSGYNVTLVSKEPPVSDMMLGRYDAVVVEGVDGAFTVRSLKSCDLEEELRRAIENPGAAGEDSESRGAGANILGYLILVILLQGILFTGLYSEDRENGALKRIASTPSGAGGYLLAQGASGFVLIFSSAFLVICAAKFLFRLDVGFSLVEYAGYLTLLTLGSIAFALFVATIAGKPDDASAMGSSVALFTTILAGSYHDFSSSRPVLDALLNVLPQKSFLSLVEGANLLHTLPEFIYLLAAPILLIALNAFLANRGLKTGA